MIQSKKEIFHNHLSQKWVLYALYAILSIFIWTWAIGMVTKDKKKETVNVWIAAYDGNPGKIAEILEASQSEYLKHTRVTIENPDHEYFSVFFQAVASDADIVIMPSSKVEMYKESIRAQFINLLDLDSVLDDYLDKEYEFLTIENSKCGIKIHSKDDPINKDSLIVYEKGVEDEEYQDYYLFLNKKSLHLKGLNDSELDGALFTLECILKDVIQ